MSEYPHVSELSDCTGELQDNYEEMRNRIKQLKTDLDRMCKWIEKWGPTDITHEALVALDDMYFDELHVHVIIKPKRKEGDLGLKALLREIHEQLTLALYAGYNTDEGAARINWCQQRTRYEPFKLKEQGE